MQTKIHRSILQRNILGIPIAALKLDLIPSYMVALIGSKGKKTFFYVNAHCLNLAHQDREYQKILRNATLVYSGGLGPVLASKILGRPLKERTPTPDFIEDVLAVAQAKQWSLYLLGSELNSLKTAVVRWQQKFPRIKIAGYHHGFFKQDEEEGIRGEINQLKPTIVLVGMGSTQQEKWIARNREQVDAKVFWAVGALFDVVSGKLPRAPRLMRELGLEWLFRLFQEPRRLWKRYTIGNLQFLCLVLKDLIKL